MANFKGFKQASLDAYLATDEQERKNYLWFVREFSGDSVVSASIYFGNRKYADVNDDTASDAKVDSIINTLGELIDENGEWVGFLPFEDHDLLGGTGITSISDALSVLEAAILENSDAIAGKVSEADYNEKVAELEGAIAEKVNAVDYNEKIAELEGKIEEISDETVSALTEEINTIDAKVDAVSGKVDTVSDKADALEESLSAVTEILDTKADASDVYTKGEVYTKEEVDAKVAGVFHFVDNADSVSADETTISYNGEDIVASEENAGDVYQIGDAEYASNGSKWVKLGFNIDLTDYATKEYVDSGLTAEAAAREALEEEVATAQEAIAQEIQARENLANEVEEVRNASTTTAATFSDADQLDLQLGQIVYVKNEEVISGITYIPGAYINTQDGLRKLDSTTPSTSVTLDERVESLENTVGGFNTVIGSEAFEGDSLTAAVAALQENTSNVQTIEGDDVEE